MIRWPFRVKLIVGLGLVIGMILTLLGGSAFGLHAFHTSNLILTNQLRELGASKKLLVAVMEIDSTSLHDPERRRRISDSVEAARQSLLGYYHELKSNSAKNRADDGRDELALAFLMDDDLLAITRELDPKAPNEHSLPGATHFLERRSLTEATEVVSTAGLEGRIQQLKTHVLELPKVLHQDFYAVLLHNQRQYHSSRWIVWSSSLAVLGMLISLMVLFHRWVLGPVRLLLRGVRRVARGSFDYTIQLKTGDEMQSLAEAFNEMTQRLRQMYDNLEQQVEERSKQLVRSERLAGVGFLAAGVAHEINNPLASIAFCSEAIERRLGSAPVLASEPDARAVRDYLRMIQEEAFRCKRITERLLDFSRCSEIQREWTDLAELISSVVEMVLHMGKYRSRTIVFQPREPVSAFVDAQEIKQVVLNLTINALDSMENGGTLSIDLHVRAGAAEMSFRDDGCGMSPETLDNIFEPFFTKRKDGKGTGLGLSISHRIIAQHQGEITAVSDGEGHGSVFTVRIPLKPPIEPNHSRGQRAA